MTKIEKKSETKCIDCEHYLLKNETVSLDLIFDSVVATAKYICEKGDKPNMINWCDHYSRAIIEDAIVWKRGDVDEDP
jgi:hypothetical protein